MLYLYTNEDKQAAWQEPFEALYIRELTKLKFPFEVIAKDTPGIRLLTPHDFVWIMHYKDLKVAETLKRATGCRIISMCNGTAANPYIYQINQYEEHHQMTAIIDIALVFNARQAHSMKWTYPEPYYIETGFPVEVPKLRKKKKAKTIVVPGRISPDRQFYLSTYLLAPLLSEGYEITFAVPEGEFEKSQQWLDLYHIENFTRRGFKLEFYKRDEFHRKLAESEFIFLASLGDICSVSLAEGLMLGCYPVVPMFGDGLPTYDEVVSLGYEPFSRKGVKNIIYGKESNPFVWDKKLYSPRECAKKLIKGLKEYDTKKA